MHCKHVTGGDDEGWAGARTIIFQRSATCSGRFTYSLAKKSSAPPAALMGYARARTRLHLSASGCAGPDRSGGEGGAGAAGGGGATVTLSSGCHRRRKILGERGGGGGGGDVVPQRLVLEHCIWRDVSMGR